MKLKTACAAAAIVVAVGSVPAGAQDLTGTWEVTSEGRRGPQTSTLELVQSGSELTGTLTLTMGGRRGGGGGAGRGGGGGAQTLEIADGTVEGGDFSFTVVLSFGGNSISQTYSGAVEGDDMEGTVEGGRGGGRPFTGTRGG